MKLIKPRFYRNCEVEMGFVSVMQFPLLHLKALNGLTLCLMFYVIEH